MKYDAAEVRHSNIMTRHTKQRIFISHASQDHNFAQNLAQMLDSLGFSVWYDKWEIAVGDSIVDKVFDGLRASDVLIVLLSSASVNSRWVKEELSTAVMRRIDGNNIRILPVLIETCEVPTSLRHIRYADFRDDPSDGLTQLLDSLAPEHKLWRSLAHFYDHFRLICAGLLAMDLNTAAEDDLIKLHDLLESALDLRTEIDLRRTRGRIRDLKFFDKIAFLAEEGIDVRSQTWNVLVGYRGVLTHEARNELRNLSFFAAQLKEAAMLRENYPSANERDALNSGIQRLEALMKKLCFEEEQHVEERMPPELPNNTVD